MEDNPIEIEFQLKLIKSQRGNQIIIEGNNIYIINHIIEKIILKYINVQLTKEK